MAISLTCSCGARLEIDDKFAGKVIPCPDCNKPLTTVTNESPREVPVSGVAIASLALALAGGCTVIGSLGAIGLGYAALRQMARTPDKVGGVNFARAGMIVGGFMTFLMLGVLFSSSAFGVDSLLRNFRQASEMDWATDIGGQYKISQSNLDYDLTIQRPSSAWAKLRPGDRAQNDLLTLVNLRDDAHLVCLPVGPAADEEAALDKAGERFRQSDLVKNLTRPSDARGQATEPEAKKVPDSKNELTIDVRLAGYERTFLLRVVKVGKGGDMFLLAAGARKGRFTGLEGDFRKAFDTFKVREEKPE